jgi:hypothetical protein
VSIFRKFFCIVLVVSTQVWGQTPTAQISGTVRDSSGLVVTGAEIKVTQTATGLVRSIMSASDGDYVLPTLPIGPYLLEISKPGFDKFVQSGIVLQVGSNPTVDVALKVGSVGEQVVVQADAELLETRSTGVGQVVDSKRVLELPLNGRNPTELIFLAGLANVAVNATGNVSSVRNYPTVAISVAGGIANGVGFQLDGTNHNDPFNNLNYPLPFPDALQEFKVETSALPAHYGIHSAAAVNAVTKSGTNDFHGDLFEFLRNGDLNARNFFAPARDTLKRNQFGGVLGGPVKRDSLFFFVAYQGTLQRSDPGQNTAYVPTPDMLRGDFSTIAGPSCNGGKAITLAAAQGFANNQLPVSSLNPAALIIQKRLPATTDPCGKVQFGLRSNSDEHMSVVKMDYQINSRHSIFGRASVSLLDIGTSYDGRNALTVSQDASHFRGAALTLGDTYLIGSNIVSSFRIGATRMDAPKIPDNFAKWQDLGVNASSFLAPTIRLTVSGNGFAIGSGNSIAGAANTGPNYNIVEDISWVKGSHQIGFGANYLFQMLNSHTGINATGVPTFTGQITGLSLADFMVGQAVTWSQGNEGIYYHREHHVGLYVEDTWKATPRLTVNYGLRWEPYFPIYHKYGYFDHFDPGLFTQGVRSQVFVNAPAGLYFPGDPQWISGNGIAPVRYNQFEPRVGLAWATGDGKMTIRAAVGRFSDRPSLFTINNFAQNAPFGNTITLNNVNLSNPWANYPGGVNPLPIGLSKTLAFPSFAQYLTAPATWKPTAVNQWNLSIQRQVGKDWLLTANYIGNNSSHIIAADEDNAAQFLGLGPCTINGVNYNPCSSTANTNQRRPLYLQNPTQGAAFSTLSRLDDGGTGNYQGLFLSASKRLSNGISILANHTYSHCISDLWNAFPGQGGSAITPHNRRAERGNCNGGDQRHVFNLSAVMQAPKLQGRLLRAIASDWQFSPILKLKSAQFFTVTSGVDTALSGTGAQRPDLVNPNPYPANQSVDGWINASAFHATAPGSFSNMGIFNFRGPGLFQLDVALSRTIPISEKRSIQLRGEAFNLPNHLNPGIPVAATNSAAFGRIQSDVSGTSGLSPGNQRIIQMALKYVF